MSLEQKINYQLNKFPAVKKVIKRTYQLGMYAISPKIKSEGNIVRVSPDDKNHEYFFGYYDKSPWDATDRYMLCMRANNTWSDVSPKETADILLIDTQKAEESPERVKKIAETSAWNVQQSCMLQWMGPDYSSKVLYNDFRNGKYCSVILTLSTGKERVIEAPVYTVSADGKLALTLDFSRLYSLRPGYGYYNVPEKTAGVALPDKTAVWVINLENGNVTPLLKYTDFATFQPRPEMLEEGSVHKVNHLMLSPDGKRFMVLYRWFNGQRKYTRLVTCNVDGTDMYVLSDDDMVSHCFWKDDETILAFENKHKTGPGYYLMKDKTQEYSYCWPQFSNDGHPSYSPDRSLIVTDSYPDRARIASINIMDGDESKTENTTVARVFAPFKYDNDTRCDLHPRWNHAGDTICFDSVFEGHRGIYTIIVQSALQKSQKEESIAREDELEKASYLLSIVVPAYCVEKYIERCVNSLRKQLYKKIEIILVDDGSPDGSGALCDKYAREDTRIKVVHKANGGLSSARNAGVEAASGQYIAFVDGDDWVTNDVYEKCFSTIIHNNCDIVDFKPFYTDGVAEPDKRKNSDKITVVEGESILYDYLYRGQTETCPFSVCRKVYKRELFTDILFPEGKINEDIVTNYRLLNKAKRLVHIDNVGYMYYQNPQSITNGALRARDFDLLEASNKLCELSRNCRDARIYELAKVKMGRSYFSLLAKAALGGIDNSIKNPKQMIQQLTKGLRETYALLMRSPISINRKVMISVVAINYNLLEFPLWVYKRLRK